MNRLRQIANRAVLGLLVLISVVALSACVRANAPRLPGSSAQKSNLTPGMVKKVCKRGETSMVEVATAFGAPNMVMHNQQGQEVWTYDVISVASSSDTASWNADGTLAAGAAGGVGGGAPIGALGSVGGGAGKTSTSSQVSSSTFTLMLTFNEQETLADYRMLSTKF